MDVAFHKRYDHALHTSLAYVVAALGHISASIDKRRWLAVPLDLRILRDLEYTRSFRDWNQRHEAVWGSDPLEFLGGFSSLEYSHNATFRSALATNGTTRWQKSPAKVADPSRQRAAVDLDITFPEIDWQGLRDIYGWAALQWQAWARGEIYVHGQEESLVTLFTPGILEFYVDDVHYFGGDFYSYQRAPVTLRLAPGTHRMDARLVRDVRAMGGVGNPKVHLNLVLEKVSSAPSHSQHAALVSDFIGSEADYRLASPYGSVIIRNDATFAIIVTSIATSGQKCTADLLHEVRLVPGQSRPVAFRLECVARSGMNIKLHFHSQSIGNERQYYFSLPVVAEFQLRDIRQPHKVTFMHPGGVVSYAILRPPSRKAEATASINASFPVFLGLHGAGLEADNEIVRRSLDPLPDLTAWALFPTGGTPWSGDDWHHWGFADVETAISMIPAWIQRHDWEGPAVNTEKWIVSGHSNGGQGTWYALTHRPDKVVAAAPISGYSSIQTYVPYTFWRPADPRRNAMVQASLSSYRHELLLSNAANIPVFQQHGGADDNVPPYHSRQMFQLIREAGADSRYNEVEGKPHWWDGVITTDPLSDFYEEQVALATTKVNVTISSIENFSIVAVNPGDTGPKYGFQIMQLHIPGQYGRFDVEFDPVTSGCSVRTSNIQMARVPTDISPCDQLDVDGQRINLELVINVQQLVLTQDYSGDWHIEEDSLAIPLRQPRRGRQLASMDAVLRTEGTFQIVTHSPEISHIALQISRNLCQYFAADTLITNSYASALEATGNIISVAIGNSLPAGFYNDDVLYVRDNELYLRRGAGESESRFAYFPTHGLAAIFLRPLPLGRVELVVWGADAKSLAVAARLVPMMTGSGQPDFVVTDRRMLAKGLEGVLAMGFLDHDWKLSKNAFVS